MNNIVRSLKNNFLWVLFVGFAIMGVATMKDDSIFISNGPHSFGKYLTWLIFFAFLGYTIYCSNKENFFKSIKRMNEMLWGRQVGLDLYIGLILPMAIIYMHGGSFVFFLWLIPVLINANLFTLLYFALNYDSLIAHFNI